MGDVKKIEEGLELVRTAEKCLKTTLLKWRPDFDVAAGEYSKAATCFKLAKSYEQCKECHLKASDCHRQNRSLFNAARSLEQAVLVCKEIGNLNDVAPLADKASTFYQQQGSYDAAASALDKAAKIIESTQPENALRLYQRAADVVSGEDNPRQAAEYVSKIARILVKLQMYDQAADAIRREIGLHQQSESLAAIGRLAVALVLVQLARGDTVAAEKAFKEWGNCCDAPEVQTLEMLLQAYDEEEPEQARRALNSPFIKHMDVEYARLARDLPLPECTVVGPPKASVRPNAAPSYVSPNSKPNQEQKPQPSPGHHEEDNEFSLC
uniref:Gamma-soluble NSF attachment protein n=1 Tax=Lygus hesperus TaxID=30085 RepID=A0A146LWN8_LYGHE